MADGSIRVVPPQADRQAIVERVHGQTGHFGIKRTLHLVLANYWWPGVTQFVVEFCRRCAVCARVRSAATPLRPQLQPLPIMGLFYRWGVDLAGPFDPSARGNTFLFIAIEHFSKTIEVVPIPSKQANHTADAFRAAVLCRYASPAEVITDGGHEFLGEFDALLREALIDHCVTSPQHPASNGLAERTVKTLKEA